MIDTAQITKHFLTRLERYTKTVEFNKVKSEDQKINMKTNNKFKNPISATIMAFR